MLNEKQVVDRIRTIMRTLRMAVESKRYIDVGMDAARCMGTSEMRLSLAVALLEDSGYTTHYIKREGSNEIKIVKILAPPGTLYIEVYGNRDKIFMINSDK